MAICGRSICQQCFHKFKTWKSYRPFVFRQYHAITLKTNLCHYGGTFGRSKNRLTIKSCFSNKPQQHTVSFVVSRGPLQWIANKIKLFLVNSYFDADFDEDTFLKGAKQAVITVSALIGERKFNQLQGLLTDEAIENLKDEISLLNDVESYHITMDDILQTKIHDIGFQYDDAEKGKKWLHVMVSCICGSESREHKELANRTLVRIPIPRMTSYSFCKECTAGIDGDWIITQVINFKQDTTG